MGFYVGAHVHGILSFMKTNMELLAPAGGMEQLIYAIHFGADAVYMASDRFGMRRRAENFTQETLPEAVAYAHNHGVKVHVTVNTVMSNDDIQELPEYLAFLDEIGVDALIISDIGCLILAREYAPHVELHLSTQASCMNWMSAKAWHDLGVKRIVCAREMSLTDIFELHRHIPEDLEVEAFVHGAMCMAYSGRCLISDYINNRSANKGHCTQPCRWKYTLMEESRPGEYFPIEEDASGSFIMSSKDMNMLSHLDELASAGIDSIKIEGRAKGMYYTAMVVNAYRHVLDGEDPEVWQRELEAISHRVYCTGFYYGDPGQTQGGVEYATTRTMVACVTECESLDDGGYLISVACRNRFFEASTLEVVSPGKPVRMVTIRNLSWRTDRGGFVQVDVANRTMAIYTFIACEPLDKLDILREVKIKTNGRTV